MGANDRTHGGHVYKVGGTNNLPSFLDNWGCEEQLLQVLFSRIPNILADLDALSRGLFEITFKF